MSRYTATSYNKQGDSLGCDGSQSLLSARKLDRQDVNVLKPSIADYDVII